MMKTWSSSRSMSRTAQSARRASRCESRARRPIDQSGGKRDIIAVPRVPDSPYCPVQVVLDWQVAADITTSPLLAGCTAGIAWACGSPPRASRSVKPRASQAGLKAAEAYAGHGLRRGF